MPGPTGVKQEIIKLLHMGIPGQEIVDFVGCSWSTVKHHAARNGLTVQRLPKTDPAILKARRNAESRQYYEANKESMIESAAERRDRYRAECYAKIAEYHLTHPCVDCEESDMVVLDFDHVRGEKVAGISAMVARGFAWERIEAEMAKCDVRCANCHRRKTAAERGFYKVMEVPRG